MCCPGALGLLADRDSWPGKCAVRNGYGRGDLGHGYSRDLKLTCSSRRSTAGSLLLLHGEGGGGGEGDARLSRKEAGWSEEQKC